MTNCRCRNLKQIRFDSPRLNLMEAISRLAVMLFMVIEHFHDGDSKAVGERFKNQGRMLPEGVVYQTSWMESTGTRCFQVMESPSRELLDVWVRRWNDLIDFEIIPIMNSKDFWDNTRQ